MRPEIGPSVLVVDDVREVRELFAHFLGRAGMRVTTVDGARAALATVRDAPPDLIVTDIEMPDMNGLDLCRLIRTDPVVAGVPLLVVSGSAPSDEAARAAGCDAVLEKPCSGARLVATARTLLGEKAPAPVARPRLKDAGVRIERA
jgi:CheY-like chemotaxis protein